MQGADGLKTVSATSNAVSVEMFCFVKIFIIVHHLMKSHQLSYILPSFSAACHDSTLVTKFVSVSLPVQYSTSDPELCKLQHPDRSSLTSVLKWENWGMTSKTDEEM